MDTESASLIAWSFGVAAGTYSLLAVFLLSFDREWHAGLRARTMLIAVFFSAIWAGFSFLGASGNNPFLTLSASLSDIFRHAAWYAFLVLLLIPNDGKILNAASLPAWLIPACWIT
ncbi:MAG TPA: hypothetical protein VLA64_01965, partial [Azonexus sp.]|nr:hypothetical protein [Azonexus sp.]